MSVDQYGRLLRYVIRGRDGLNVNVYLVRIGAAAPYFYRGVEGPTPMCSIVWLAAPGSVISGCGAYVEERLTTRTEASLPGLPPEAPLGPTIAAAMHRTVLNVAQAVGSAKSSRGGSMAVAYVQEFPIRNRSTTNYDFVAEKVGDGPFDGLIAHTAGFDDQAGVFRILDVWETREHAERFLAEHLQPLMEEGPGAFPDPGAFAPPAREGFYELHHVVRG